VNVLITLVWAARLTTGAVVLAVIVHAGGGVLPRVVQRVLNLTAAIWHNDRTGQPIKRSLLA